VRSLRWLGLLTAVLCAAASPAVGQAWTGFDGPWQRVSPERDEVRLQAINTALAGLSWVTRAMAGPILRRSTTPPERYVFRVDADGIALGQRGREPRPLSTDGSEREFEGDRGNVTTSARQVADGLETRWRTGQAHGSTTFRLADDGATLVVQSVLQITAISGVEPIRYEARFQRAPSVSSSPR
jgi:hypothetical protein